MRLATRTTGGLLMSQSLFFLLGRAPPTSILFPYTTLFRSIYEKVARVAPKVGLISISMNQRKPKPDLNWIIEIDRKSTRLNSSHQINSYAVFCLKKKRSDARTGRNRDRKFPPEDTVHPEID